jgi:hypothetical protein
MSFGNNHLLPIKQFPGKSMLTTTSERMLEHRPKGLAYLGL